MTTEEYNKAYNARKNELLTRLYALRPESYIFTDRPNAPLDEIERNIALAERDLRFTTMMTRAQS